MSFLRKILMLLNREVPTETLINRGMKVGENFNRQQGCFLDPTHCFLITIGDDVTMSIRVTVMALRHIEAGGPQNTRNVHRRRHANGAYGG